MVRQLCADGWECHIAVPGEARLASEYAAAGAHLHVIAMERLTTSGNSLRWVRYLARWPLTVIELTRLARVIDVDVVHTNSLHSWYGWAVAVLVRRPHVWHAREVVFQSGSALRVERWLTRHFAARVIAISQVVANQLPGAPVEVVTDEADPERFSPSRAGRFRTEQNIADSVVLIGCVARLDTWKGFGTLLDAFEILRPLHPGIEVVLVGSPVPGKEGYAAEIQARSSRTPGVRWMGSRRDVEDVMADLDVFVQVSSEPEPFGLVVVEALASGVPVVAGREGGPARDPRRRGSRRSCCGRPSGRSRRPSSGSEGHRRADSRHHILASPPLTAPPAQGRVASLRFALRRACRRSQDPQPLTMSGQVPSRDNLGGRSPN